jgi:NAD(P)-dependent dehydrogenase (short-subunit alcohol dehydrogenase family)
MNLTNKTAVITGAASGIGLALAKHALANGMNIAIADVEAEALQKAVAALQKQHPDATILSMVVDVSNADQIKAFANATEQRFGSVNLLFNNAGIGGGGPTWEIPMEEWDWVLNVNLRGVIAGVHHFTPLMLNQDVSHIVNTASVAGLMSTPSMASYTVAKHGVVALSEVLLGDLRNAGHETGVSVLCPSFVNTQIYNSQRNRPQALSAGKSEAQLAEEKAIADASGEFFRTTLAPEDVAAMVFDAIEAKQFYILTHPNGSREQVKKRMQQILDNGSPDVSGPEALPFD